MNAGGIRDRDLGVCPDWCAYQLVCAGAEEMYEPGVLEELDIPWKAHKCDKNRGV